jgi:hypothetical protein
MCHNYALCYALEHAARLENKRRQDDPAEVGARPELGYQVRQDIPLILLDDFDIIAAHAPARALVAGVPALVDRRRIACGGGAKPACQHR